MYKVKFIYNPFSGENVIVCNVDNVIKIFQEHNLTIVPYRISLNSSMSDAFDDIDDSYKYVLIAGGDGTVDNVVNCMKKMNIDLPIAILPAGTANDFATILGMPRNIEEACDQIVNGDIRNVDLGKINDKYFINVASMGLFTDVSQKTDINFKNTMGKLAYYLKGIEQIPKFRSLKIKVDADETKFDGDMFLMLIFNGRTAGNMNFAYKAKIDDGLLDVIIVRAVLIGDAMRIFLKILASDHLENDSGVVYFKTNKLKVYCHEDIVTDIDGERGPDFPLDIQCIKGGLRIVGSKMD